MSTNTVVTLDIRTPQEYARGHMPGAVLVHTPSPPLKPAQICHLTQLLAHIAQDLGPHVTIQVYCRKGVRAGLAAALLRNLGHKRVRNLGGLYA